MKTPWKAVFAVCALAAVAAFSCGKNRPGIESSVRYKAKTYLAKQEKFSQEIASFGTIAYKSKNDVTATVEGTIVELPVVEGAFVRSGTLLARLRNVQLEMSELQAAQSVATARSAVELAQAKLWEGCQQVEARILSIEKSLILIAQKEYEIAELESSYAKKKDLLEIGGTTEEDVNSLLISLNAQRSSLAAQKKDVEISRIGLRNEDLAARGVKQPGSEKERTEALVIINTLTLRAEVEAAKSQLESAETQLSSVREMLAELRLRAPSDGIVGALYTEKGEHLTQNAKVMTLMDTKEVYAVFPIQESDSNRIREGLRVDVSIDAFKDRVFSSAISQIAPLIDSQTGAVTVKAIMPNKSNQLRPGMFIRARIDLGSSREVVKLPDSAIIQKRGTVAKVFAVVNGKAFMKEVELGEELDGAHIVEKGIKSGDIVIDSPSPLLKEGEDVQIED